MNDKSDSFEMLSQEIRESVSKKNLSEIERTLGLPEFEMDKLIDDPSDWSFVVKLAVIIEAALTQAIASKLDTTGLHQHLSRLTVGGRAGKIQLAKDLEIIDLATSIRLKAIASIRNVFAHDISVIGLSLGAYVASMEKSEQVKLLEALLSLNGKEPVKKVTEISERSARYLYWVAGILSLFALAQAYKKNTNSQRWTSARMLIGEAFLAQRTGDQDNYKSKLEDALALLREPNV